MIFVINFNNRNYALKYKMTYYINKQITSFDQIDWINVQTLIGDKITTYTK